MQPEYRARVSMKNPVHFCALGFGSGLIPLMPGTFGSLAAIPLILLLAPAGNVIYITATILSSIAGVYFCGKTATDMGVHDHGSIVWDEVAGMLLTFLFVPLSMSTLIAGFVLFRIFDILKPWPIGPVDKTVHGGLGIMLDDILAGIMACVCLHGLIWLVPAIG
ncbi:phosphatidylglycerophosphatase A family protein [Alteromonas sp. RKMC-009]|uniref:phosphatidylglycerophosphatase A family protein n=1 Tax=Alteromonas sp. RKMC-009 TaxID=2267264 RepID=UPI000E68073B|nr:phosphatidylglycerophosphatase A [Alteromonas sp. RKMC-009]AYA65061.1 phosphatidylglycerophosphatase A [Alteromonas sp. RKMC-009]